MVKSGNFGRQVNSDIRLQTVQILMKGSLSPYLTGLRLFCDSWRQTSRVGRKAVSKQSQVIRNFLACVAKWRKVVAKILNNFAKGSLKKFLLSEMIVPS